MNRTARTLVLLDNEAVQALRDPAHPHHRRVISHLQVIVGRRSRAADIEPAVPTTVRVEAGWDRTSPHWALANRLRIRDVVLDGASADAAALIRRRTGVSVADRIIVLTSDPGDIRAVAEGRPVTVVTL